MRSLLAGSVLVLALAGVASAAPGGRVPWVRSPSTGLAQAARTGRTALMYFTADW